MVIQYFSFKHIVIVEGSANNAMGGFCGVGDRHVSAARHSSSGDNFAFKLVLGVYPFLFPFLIPLWSGVWVMALFPKEV